MKTVIVTGGAGFIGSHVSEALLKKDIKVVSIDSLNDFYDPNIKRRNIEEILHTAESIKEADRYIACKGDIRDINFLDKVFKDFKPDAVIHLAAFAGVRPSILDPHLYADVNIGGTLNLLECIKKFDVKAHIFASSSSVYGNNKNVPFTENDIVDFPISPYAATKKSGELICHTFHHLYDINTACMRFFTVYGPRQRPDLAIYKFTKAVIEDSPVLLFGDGSIRRDYTYISDIVDGIMKALDWVLTGQDKFEVFNIGASRTISLLEMVETIESVLGKKAVKQFLPIQPGDVNITYANIAKAKEMLGYNPSVAFEDGVTAFVKWYKAMYN